MIANIAKLTKSLAKNILVCTGIVLGTISNAQGQTITQIVDLNPGPDGSNPNNFTVIDDLLVFEADDGTGIDLFTFDGTTVSEAGDITLPDELPPATFPLFNDLLVFEGNDGIGGPNQIFGFDGSEVIPLGLVPTSSLFPPLESLFPSEFTSEFTAVDSLQLFSVVEDLDGNTFLSFDVTPPEPGDPIAFEPIGVAPIEFALFNDVLVFSAAVSPASPFSPAEFELLSFDGENVEQLADINVGPDGSLPNNFIVFNDTLIFSADNGTDGFELFSFDGENVEQIADINPGPDGSFPNEFTIFNDLVVFEADNGTDGNELFSIELDTSTVPEPSSVVSLLALGMGFLYLQKKNYS